MRDTIIKTGMNSAPDPYQQVRQEIKAKGPEGFARMMESAFLQQMLQQMNKALLSKGLFGDSHQGKIYQGLFTEALADQISKSGGLGLADVISQQLNSSQLPTENPRKIDPTDAPNNLGPSRGIDIPASNYLEIHAKHNKKDQQP